ncbi:MAG: tRNA (adenosine(37)-N6)-threonylcarbamoyltransferase complex ATPase subunit type 1 TsaE [Nitrospira sp.]|nr:tRNA (adenosine(37)-N6)-threonylcarbamoyltransferase complex ATPase subunit type 1 TsaE [Nitrospira sp.]
MPSRRPHTPKPVPSPAAPLRQTTAGSPPIGKPWHIVLRSPKHTHRLGRCLGTLLQGGEVLALFGELGAGKTSLVKGIADGLLAEPTDVSSPTFTLIHEYRGRLPLVHSDLYRLTAAQLEDTGLNDYLDGHTVTAIEWADRWGDGLPSDRLDVHLSHRPPAARRAILTARGPAARRLLDALRSRLSANRPTRAAQQTRVQLSRPRRASH